ncbi:MULTISPECIES: hypothetical protein [unclassified Pseudomonas]|uniref:hypothetical protein n=1 Tax=unclassified Pseudomonas TaxID=196821 RepID=UPI001CBF27A1|nr:MULTISPECIES: hypothetical protein [unclassified Pseudomonas]
MDLHIPTLLVVSVFVFILMGLLTCHAWWRDTGELPLAYLGAMMLLAALGVVLISWRGRYCPARFQPRVGLRPFEPAFTGG